MATESWESIAAAKRQALSASIPTDWRIPASELPAETVLDVTSLPITSTLFEPHELVITSASAAQILENVRNRTWTAAAVTKAFCKRAAMAHQLVATMQFLSNLVFD